MSAGEIGRTAEAIVGRTRGRHLLLLFDFDGTLCEFSTDPEAVRLPAHRRALLESIASRRDATVAIVSGRRLADVRCRVALLTAAYYSGLHGLEIEGGGEMFRHPDVTATAELVQTLGAALADDFQDLAGVFVEDKELSVVAHYRAASPADALRARDIVARRAGPYLDSGVLRLMRGSCMTELLPNIGWDKGNAVEWICEHVSRNGSDVVPVYIGDDVTDEDGFRVVRGRGVAISAATRASGAEFFLDGPLAVEELLRTLAPLQASASELR